MSRPPDRDSPPPEGRSRRLRRTHASPGCTGPARPARCCSRSLPGRRPQARPAGDGAQPGHVRRRGRRRARPRSWPSSDPSLFALVGRGLAVADGRVRQPRRGGGRGPRQGAGRDAAPRQDRDHRAPAARRRHRGGRPGAAAHGSATGSWSRPARSSPATATSSRASPASTSPRSPASRHRSSASPAATAARSPAAPRCSPTGSSSQITAKPGESFIDRMIALVEGAVAAEDPERDRAEHPAGQPDHRVPDGDRRPCSRSRSTPAPSRSLIVLVALLVCLIPTTIGALLSAIGIAGHGPAGAAQRAGDVRACGRGRRRREHPAAGQDRHHHAGQPAGRRVPARSPGSPTPDAGRRRAAVQPGRRDPRGPVHRGARQDRARAARARARASCRPRTSWPSRRRPG